MSKTKKSGLEKPATVNQVQINNDTAIIQNSSLLGQEIITKEKIISYLQAFNFTNLSKNEANQFIEIATAFQLNPFKREIYCIPYDTRDGRKLSIITGYEVYLKRADRLNKLNGWNVETTGNIKDGSLKAIITIYRKDWKQPFKHEALYKECVQYKGDGNVNKMWSKMPAFMLKKVAIAQGFRLCFPDEFGGMPYTSDELPDNMTNTIEINPIAEKQDIKENEKQETEKKDNEKIPNKWSKPDDKTNSPLQSLFVEYQNLYKSLKSKLSTEDHNIYLETIKQYYTKSIDEKTLKAGISFLKNKYVKVVA